MPINFNIKILYVEDEYITREEVKNILKTKYKNVLDAQDGEIGYSLFESETPDLIITDLRMPNCDGIEMVRKIRETNTTIPIIVASAF